MSHLVIDGYNVIRQSQILSEIDAKNLERARLLFLKELGSYQVATKHEITVVFDAMNGMNFKIEEEWVYGCRVLYSHQGQSADDVIRLLIKLKKQNLVIITSDRDILKTAKSYGCGILDSTEFAKKMRQTPPAKEESSWLTTGGDKEWQMIQQKQSWKPESAQTKNLGNKLPKNKRKALNTL